MGEWRDGIEKVEGHKGHGKWKTANGGNEGNGKDGRIDIVKDNDV